MLPRISDVVDEHLRMMTPIDGYQNVRLMSLEETVKPIGHLFHSNNLSGLLWTIKERCKNPSDGLSQDESASIMLYTYEWGTPEHSLYAVLNRTLRTEDRNLLKPWFPYLRLLIGALIKLPAINDTIYRGLKGSPSHLYITDALITWWGFSSCTECLSLLESDKFCGQTGVRTMFNIKCLGGRNVKKHSYFSSENEILLLPGRYLKVCGVFRNADGLSIIRLDEVIPPHELLLLPDNAPWRRIHPGISVLGICMNSSCVAYTKEVIIPIGFKKFDVLGESISIKCPACAKYVEASKLGFSECQWRIDRITQASSSQPPMAVSEDWSSTHGYSLVEYTLCNSIWRKLIVEAKPKNTS